MQENDHRLMWKALVYEQVMKVKEVIIGLKTKITFRFLLY